MDSNLEKVRARARLLLAADNLRELLQFLERDVPMLIAEVERLQHELAEAKRYDGRVRLPVQSPRAPTSTPSESQLLTSKQFANAIGVTEACVRKWRLLRKINVVRLGRLVRVPRTEVQRVIEDGAIPARSPRS